MRVIGTAGHVDHGKSTLVKALTGIDPDRLKEEKKRQMTIDLGFAWYESPLAGPIGIVDVPGHRDFIENMLAGVGGIDAVLLVIAADEGIMPQTNEHLSIINLLYIKTGLIALTKVDLVDDPAWLDLVEMDVREKLSGSLLENAPILRVSALTGGGIQELRAAIDSILLPLAARVDLGKPRLPVDRVFSLTGFGTVVTGTLMDGTFSLDSEVEILPSGKKARIRGLQTHKKSGSQAYPGSRTAVNLNGVDVEDIKRGDLIVHPGMFNPTSRIDAMIELLPDAAATLKHNEMVKLFVLTSESNARVRLLQKKELKPGESGWVQIEFEKETVMEKDDRFIIRRMSPAQTLGGGVVVDAHPVRRYKLDDPMVIERLEIKNAPSQANQVYSAILENPFTTNEEILKKVGFEPLVIQANIEQLIKAGEVVALPGRDHQVFHYVDKKNWQGLITKVEWILSKYHQQNPLKGGINVDEMARRMKLSLPEMEMCTNQWRLDNLIKENYGLISLNGFHVKYSANQAKRLDQFMSTIDQQPFNPLTTRDAKELLTDDVYLSLLEQGVLIQLSSDVVVRRSEYDLMLQYVLEECNRGISLTLAQFRDHFATNRRVSQSFLEYLDRKGITRREGEGRRLQNKL